MKCVICKNGDVETKTATFTVDKDGHALILRNVPARVCRQCGEPYFNAEVTSRILQQAEKARMSGIDVAILHYQAA